MPVKVPHCVNCIKMDYDVEEGRLPREFVEYDFAEDALDFEVYLAEAQNVIFSQPLPEPLSIGSLIICTGTPSNDLPRIALDIGCGTLESSSPDIAIHYNIRLPQRYVVRNTRRHNKWGLEETTSFRSFPFEFDRPFTIEILFDENETLWAIDGELYCSYAHRNPSPFSASWIQVAGVRDAGITIKKTHIFPSLAPEALVVPYRESSVILAEDHLQPQWRPNVLAIIPNGIPEGHQIVIYAKVRPLLHSFSVALSDTCREWPRPNVLAHVCVLAQLGRQLVVLNSRLDAWGAERRQHTAKLVPGTHTTIRIVNSAKEWIVYADDVVIGELEHRGASDGVRALTIRGDLYPEHIYVCPATSSPIKEGKILLCDKNKNGNRDGV